MSDNADRDTYDALDPCHPSYSGAGPMTDEPTSAMKTHMPPTAADEMQRLLGVVQEQQSELDRLHQQLSTAHSRLLDMMQGDDGQAWKEARKYLAEHAPEALAQWRGELREPVAERREPVLWTATVNGAHEVQFDREPPEDAYDAGTLRVLYEGAPPAQSAVPNEAQIRALEEVLRTKFATFLHWKSLTDLVRVVLSATPSRGEAQGDGREAWLSESELFRAIHGMGRDGPSEDEVTAEGRNYGDWEAGFMCAYNIALCRLRAAIAAQRGGE